LRRKLSKYISSAIAMTRRLTDGITLNLQVAYDNNDKDADDADDDNDNNKNNSNNNQLYTFNH